MTQEQLEFSISQYLDGSLPAAETAALEARLSEDVAARVLLDEYRKLNALLKAAPAAAPAIEWGRLGDHLCAAVVEAGELEFAISQYADGSLAAPQVPVVEAKLAEDAKAQAALREHQRLNELLKNAALPAIRWNRLAEHLADTVAEANAPRTIKLFANPWVRAVGGLAIAACVTVVSMIVLRGHHGSTPGQPIVNVGPLEVASSSKPIDVEIGIGGGDGSASAGSNSAVAEVTIGAGSDQGGGEAPIYAEGIVTHSPRSLIATSAPTAQDTASMPY